MATQQTRKPSEPGEVNRYMKGLRHPLSEVVEALRQIILRADPEIGEEIKWNSPTFFYTGEMRPSNPKEYKRYLVVFNLFRKDCIRPLFWGGAKVKDTSGLLESEYADGRRLAMFYDMEDVKAKEKSLRAVIRHQLRLLEK